MAAANSGTPLPSVATVLMIGGVHLSDRMASVCMERISRSTRSAPSRSLLLMTKNVGNFHNAGLDGLHVIAHAGDKNHNGHIGQPHNIDFILADSYSFNH